MHFVVFVEDMDGTTLCSRFDFELCWDNWFLVGDGVHFILCDDVYV